jgi:lipopolysaccharide export system protein LptA
LVLPLLCAAQTAAPMPPAAPGGAPTSGGASANDHGINLDTGDDKQPMQIDADQGLEWRQNDKVYIARGNVKVVRGKGTIYADIMIAHYRPKPADPKKPAQTDKAADPTGGTEIYLVDADGNVRMESGGDTLYCEHAVFNFDDGTLVATGKNLKLVTEKETVTARDSIEWYDHDQIGVARGNAVAIQDQKVLRADVLIAATEKDQKGGSQLSRVDAQGNVKITSQDQIGQGDSGVYNADTGIVTLVGHVRVTRGTDELRGQYAVVDTKRNVSRLLSAPPGGATLANGQPRRVEGWLKPEQAQPQPGGSK